MIVDILSWIAIGIGAAFILVGGLGLIRMPDFFTRLHATSVADTAGAGFILLGLMLQAGLSLTSFKLVLIFVFLVFTAPDRGTRAGPRGAARRGPALDPQAQGPRAIDIYVDILLLVLLVAAALIVVSLRNLLAAALVLGIYSLVMAALWVVLDAVDVAFTEAAVGAGVTTVFMLLAIAATGRHEKIAHRRPWLPILISLAVGGLLVYGTLDLPAFGDPQAPAQLHVGPHYIEQGEAETGVPNIVTAVLASYRGFDTLGEVTVIFTAGIGVLLMLGIVRRRRHADDDSGDRE